MSRRFSEKSYRFDVVHQTHSGFLPRPPLADDADPMPTLGQGKQAETTKVTVGANHVYWARPIARESVGLPYAVEYDGWNNNFAVVPYGAKTMIALEGDNIILCLKQSLKELLSKPSRTPHLDIPTPPWETDTFNPAQKPDLPQTGVTGLLLDAWPKIDFLHPVTPTVIRQLWRKRFDRAHPSS